MAPQSQDGTPASRYFISCHQLPRERFSPLPRSRPSRQLDEDPESSHPNSAMSICRELAQIRAIAGATGHSWRVQHPNYPRFRHDQSDRSGAHAELARALCSPLEADAKAGSGHNCGVDGREPPRPIQGFGEARIDDLKVGSEVEPMRDRGVVVHLDRASSCWRPRLSA